MLYQHQQDGAAWLAARPKGRGYLADAPGLGKTRTAIGALDSVASIRPLIVCPAIVRTHWRREFEACNWPGGLLPPVIKSYDEIVRGGVPLMKRLFLDEKIDALVTDEHHYCKHDESQRTLALLGRNGYARRLPFVFPLSGTPIPKNPGEFWTTLSSLFPEVCVEHGLKTKAEFVHRFCTFGPGRFYNGVYRPKIYAAIKEPDEFKAILDKVMLRRTLDDVGLDVPLLDWQVTRLDGNGEMWGDIKAEEADATSAVEDALADDVLADIAADPHVARMRRRLGELKVEPVVKMLTEQLEESDEKIVVFAHHRDVLDGLWRGLARFGIALVHGDTTPRSRDTMIDLFQSVPACRVFIGQNIACQTGITLTAARRVVLVEPDWTADVNLQLGKRIARIGQRAERCVGQMIALAGTLDEAIVAQNQREVRMAETLGLGE